MINQHSTWAELIYVIQGGSPVPFHIAVHFINRTKWSRFRGTTLESSFSKTIGSFSIIFEALEKSAQAISFFRILIHFFAVCYHEIC